MKLEIGSFPIIRAALEDVGLTLAMDQDTTGVYVMDADGQTLGSVPLLALMQIFHECVARAGERIKNNMKPTQQAVRK